MKLSPLINNFAKVTDADKPHILVYRKLGYKTLRIKGFDNLLDIAKFIDANAEVIPMKRLEEGK